MTLEPLYETRLGLLALQVRNIGRQTGRQTTDDTAGALLRAYFLARGTQYKGPSTLEPHEAHQAICFLEAICSEMIAAPYLDAA